MCRDSIGSVASRAVAARRGVHLPPVRLERMALLASAIDEPFTDAELTAFALQADAEAEVGDDAVCMWDLTDWASTELLPTWYMPPAADSSRILGGWSRRVALFVIASILLINAFGLCVTYGWVTLG